MSTTTEKNKSYGLLAFKEEKSKYFFSNDFELLRALGRDAKGQGWEVMIEDWDNGQVFDLDIITQGVKK